MKRTLILLSVILLLLALATVAVARIAGYDLTWWTVDSGGGASSGGGYQLSGTIGQPDASTLSGGHYLLEGGFWHGISSAVSPLRVYLPLTTRP
jgi:hypothetical protein